MKKLLIMSLVLSTGIILSACMGTSKEEQIKGEVIHGAASAQLDEVIKEKKETAPLDAEVVEPVPNPPATEMKEEEILAPEEAPAPEDDAREA